MRSESPAHAHLTMDGLTVFYSAKVADHASWKLGFCKVSPYFGNQFAHLWWRHDREHWDSEFAALMDAALADVDQSANSEWMENLQRELAELP